jgi:hypothetical protein
MERSLTLDRKELATYYIGSTHSVLGEDPLL